MDTPPKLRRITIGLPPKVAEGAHIFAQRRGYPSLPALALRAIEEMLARTRPPSEPKPGSPRLQVLEEENKRLFAPAPDFIRRLRAEDRKEREAEAVEVKRGRKFRHVGGGVYRGVSR